MLSLNLLPPKEKQTVRIREAAEAVGFFAMLALFVLAVGIFFLLPPFLLTHFAVRELRHSLDVEEQEGVNRRGVRVALAEAKKTRTALGEIRAYAAHAPGASLILGRFFPVGEGITMLSFVIRAGGDVVVEGHAATREQLLIFEETLRASDQFLEVSFPLEDIVRESNIRFSAKAKLKPPYQF